MGPASAITLRFMPPRVTVSLVTYNGARWLPACLASISAQELDDYEVLITDNASTDDSVELLRAHADWDPRFGLTESQHNLGYAAAHNGNIVRARGEFVLLLNQDVVLEPGFLDAAVAAFEARPDVAAVQGRLRRLGPDGTRTDTIDTTGLVMNRDRRAVARRQGEREAEADLVPGPVWGADGPAPVYRREALLEAALPRTGGGVEVLDEDFFMYKEDVDLAWRLQRIGWSAWYAPAALAWHGRTAGGGRERSWSDLASSRRTIPRWILRLSWRNQRLMQLKNETAAGLRRDFPWIARREILALLLMLLTDPRGLAAVNAIAHTAPAMLPKRRALAVIIRRHRAGILNPSMSSPSETESQPEEE